MHTMRHIAIPIGNIDIGIGLNMAEDGSEEAGVSDVDQYGSVEEYSGK